MCKYVLQPSPLGIRSNLAWCGMAIWHEPSVENQYFNFADLASLSLMTHGAWSPAEQLPPLGG